MSNIPTAEEFIINKEVKQGFLLSNSTEELKDIINSHIEFAKLHVEQAIKTCIEEAPSGSSTDTVSYEDVIEALKDCYPLTNIK